MLAEVGTGWQPDQLFIYLYKFSQNLLSGLICEARTRAKQSLLRRSWPLQSDREIPGNRLLVIPGSR